METFNLKLYAKENENTKIKVFIEYLCEKFEIDLPNEEFDNMYLSLLNEDDLIESLEYYIYKNNVRAQVTANNYITYISDFFTTLSKRYKVKNEIFTDIELKNQFVDRARVIISKLKEESESRDSATDEQYEILKEEIKEFINNFNEYDIYDEINKYKAGSQKYIKFYHRFVSIIAIELVMKYALKNITTVLLELNAINMENETIIINDIVLPLDKELMWLLERYLKIRKHILDLNEIEESKLFIQHDGSLYITDVNNRRGAKYEKLFLFLHDCLGTHSAELFSIRRIIEMLDSGISIAIISKLSERSTKKCIELQEKQNVDNLNRLHQLLKGELSANKKVTIKKKGYMKCHFCDREVKATSEEWVLVQYENDSTKHLVCRKCKGEHEKSSV